MLSKLSGHIPKFFDTDVFPYGGSNFTVSKGAFRKVTSLKIDHMETVVACKKVFATLKDVKAELCHVADGRTSMYQSLIILRMALKRVKNTKASSPFSI